MDKMGYLDTKNACQVAQMPKEVVDWIFEPIWKYKAPIQKIS